MSGLLPCPFCGEQPTWADQASYNSTTEWYIKCSGCLCTTQLSKNKQYILVLWNRRAEKWIKDKLPEVDKKVLIFDPQPEIELKWRWECKVAYIDSDGYWDDGNYLECPTPTHWMPLPEPPRIVLLELPK